MEINLVVSRMTELSLTDGLRIQVTKVVRHFANNCSWGPLRLSTAYCRSMRVQVHADIVRPMRDIVKVWVDDYSMSRLRFIWGKVMASLQGWIQACLLDMIVHFSWSKSVLLIGVWRARTESYIRCDWRIACWSSRVRPWLAKVRNTLWQHLSLYHDTSDVFFTRRNTYRLSSRRSYSIFHLDSNKQHFFSYCLSYFCGSK